MSESRKLKELLDSMCEVIKDLAVKCGIGSEIETALHMDICLFLLYLSASDGVINWDESGFISEICDLNFTPDKMADMVNESNIFSTEYEQTPPFTMIFLVQADKIMRARGYKSECTDTLISLYKVIGKAMVEADGNIDKDELNDFSTYINMLENFRDMHLKKTT